MSSNYSTPIQVDGYTCRHCTDVSYAKKHIDPQHPKSDPYDVNAEADPSRVAEAVVFGANAKASDLAAATPAATLLGAVVNLGA